MNPARISADGRVEHFSDKPPSFAGRFGSEVITLGVPVLQDPNNLDRRDSFVIRSRFLVQQ